MENLQQMVPKTLQRQIAESTVANLPSTCSSLLDFFLQQPKFHQIVGDLTGPQMGLCRKNKEAALESKRKGNECFLKGDYSKALGLYSQALRVAPTGFDDMDKNLVAVLYVNRASVFHAWYRRGKADASLENYEDAARDLHVAVNMELSMSGKRQIENELKLISSREESGTSVAETYENDMQYLQ